MEALISQVTGTIIGLTGTDLPLAYHSGFGQKLTFRGIFDNAHQVQDLGDTGITSQGPQVFVQLADLPTDPEKDTDALILVDRRRYNIHAVEKDGKGGALLRLRDAECTSGA